MKQNKELDNVYTIAYNKKEYEWSDTKNKKNFRKHGIWFEEARTVWLDPNSVRFYDSEHSHNEDRHIKIGFSTSNRLLIVAYCEKEFNGKIRIISARKTTTQERRQYEERI
jgi:uncharacterized DUF497 family protein